MWYDKQVRKKDGFVERKVEKWKEKKGEKKS